jgi:hypothetical protein
VGEWRYTFNKYYSGKYEYYSHISACCTTLGSSGARCRRSCKSVRISASLWPPNYIKDLFRLQQVLKCSVVIVEPSTDLIVTGHKLKHQIVLWHSVALCIPVLALTPPSLCSLPHMLKFTPRRLFVSYYLFNTTYVGLTGHHQVYTYECK